MLQPGRLYKRRISRYAPMQPPPPLPKTAQECKGSFEASQRSSRLQKTCTARGEKKGVSVQRLVDEVQSVFWAKHAHPFDTRAYSPTLTGLRTKITPSCLLCFLLNPLQHMTCVTATDLHWKIRPVEGQGKSPKRRREERGKKNNLIDTPCCTPFLFYTDGLFEKFVFLKCLAYFMVP